MTIWAISDLHLSIASDKPMDVFGPRWDRHAEKIGENWRRLVAPEDTVLVAGDISWGMDFEQAMPDLLWLHDLPGRKIISRGNHDYWWKKISWMRKNLPPSLVPMQNDSIEVEGRTVCACRGWTIPIKSSESYEQDKRLFERERIRLQLSLDSAPHRSGAIVMIHFPPFVDNSAGPGFTDILEAGGVSTVVYGHLHADDAKTAFSGMRNGIRYLFASCDGIDFSPVKVE